MVGVGGAISLAALLSVASNISVKLLNENIDEYVELGVWSSERLIGVWRSASSVGCGLVSLLLASSSGRSAIVKVKVRRI